MSTFVFVESDKRTLRTSEDDGRAAVLVLEKIFVHMDFSATQILMDAPELQLAQEVPRHSVDLVKLRFVSAKRTGVRVLCKPLGLARSTDWLLASFAFEWTFE